MALESLPYSSSGGPEGDSAVLDLGKKSGTIILEYETFFIPDKIQLRYEGEVIYDSGFVGTQGVREVEVNFDGEEEEVTAVLTANLDDPGTLWFYDVDVEDEAFIVFREKNDGSKDGTWGGNGDLVPGWDHVGLSFNNAVYESHPGNGSGNFWDPTEEEFVSINNVNGVQQEHSLGSFLWDSQSKSQTPVIRTEKIEIDPALGEKMVGIIEPLIGSAGYQLIEDVSDFNLFTIEETLSPSAQKGGSGTYTCVGLIEWAAEQAGQGFIPNTLESFTVSFDWGIIPPPITSVEIPFLSPELLAYSLGVSNQINAVKDWFQGFFDPVDFIVTDPLGRRLGYTESLGTVNEIPGAFYTGDGSLEQFAIPEPIPGDYTIELFGLDDDVIAAVGGTSVDGALFNDFLGEGESRITKITVPERGNGGFTDLSVSYNNFPEKVEVGETYTYDVVVTNNGSNKATNVILKEEIPSSLDIISNDASLIRQFDNSFISNIGTLESGESKILSFTVKTLAAGRITNVATVTANEADPNITNNISVIENIIAPIPIADADLEITKNVNNLSPNVGEEIEFTLSLTNNGPGIASNIEVTDILPTGLSFISASSNQGSYDPTTGIWEVGNIRDGISTSLNVVAKVDIAGSFVNSAEITSVDQADPDSTPGNNIMEEDDQSEVIFSTKGIDNNKDVILGTPNDDNISGTNLAETISGEAGNDNINGNGGADILFGNEGDDNINGTNSSEQISGGEGNDRISGNGGNDTILGGAGDDDILLGSGSPTVNSGSGNDEIWVNNANATFILETGDGFDTFYGLQTQQIENKLISFGVDDIDSIEFERIGNGIDIFSAGDKIAQLDNFNQQQQLDLLETNKSELFFELA